MLANTDSNSITYSNFDITAFLPTPQEAAIGSVIVAGSIKALEPVKKILNRQGEQVPTDLEKLLRSMSGI